MYYYKRKKWTNWTSLKLNSPPYVKDPIKTVGQDPEGTKCDTDSHSKSLKNLYRWTENWDFSCHGIAKF